MNQWLVEGKWKPVIGEVFSLQDAAAAHQLQENKTLVKSAAISGKIVVEIN
jgi:NADPH:quinone reductase-like Zn-dependent oxidoreductase